MIGPLDGRYRREVEDLDPIFSESALIRYRLHVEVEWLIALSAETGVTHLPALDAESAARMRALVESFDEAGAAEVKRIEARVNHDVKSVEYYLRECLGKAGLPEHALAVHFCCTSEDINNVAYALMLRDGVQRVWAPEARGLIDGIGSIASETRDVAMLARTHGQPASPTTVGKELAVFAYRLGRQLEGALGTSFLAKFNGAVGNYNAHVIAYPDVDWEDVSRRFIEGLGLEWNPLTTQIESHDFIAELFHAMIRFNTILLDFDRDVWSYISLGYFREALVADEVGSSTMPHKVNPIRFENSEANAGVAIALLDHLAQKLPVSRMQRDLSDSSALRNVGLAVGYSVVAIRSARKGLGRLTIDAEACAADLDQTWEVLGEAIQTVLRKHNVSGSYEKLKELTRGREAGREMLQKLIADAPISEEDRERLLALTPANYIGIAPQLLRHLAARGKADGDV